MEKRMNKEELMQLINLLGIDKKSIEFYPVVL